MPANKATKTANVCANIYEGKFQINFDCVGVGMCRFALCPVMPPDGSEECGYREYGACLCHHAKSAALESLIKRLRQELKNTEALEE